MELKRGDSNFDNARHEGKDQMHVAGVKSKLDLRLTIEFYSDRYYADIKNTGFREKFSGALSCQRNRIKIGIWDMSK